MEGGGLHEEDEEAVLEEMAYLMCSNDLGEDSRLQIEELFTKLPSGMREDFANTILGPNGGEGEDFKKKKGYNANKEWKGFWEEDLLVGDDEVEGFDHEGLTEYIIQLKPFLTILPKAKREQIESVRSTPPSSLLTSTSSPEIVYTDVTSEVVDVISSYVYISRTSGTLGPHVSGLGGRRGSEVLKTSTAMGGEERVEGGWRYVTARFNERGGGRKGRENVEVDVRDIMGGGRRGVIRALWEVRGWLGGEVVKGERKRGKKAKLKIDFLASWIMSEEGWRIWQRRLEE
ncbi:hypothetical protein TrCOL_g5398 [Triparma columacea]|uniref:Uncharacterized protein n=1 Tax=Triparma columacea TaxID=722753 RepID=A0A9W7GGX3_9STRA|nr:hypothetical protein TrCOL_g5398 [Triparma columacea]